MSDTAGDNGNGFSPYLHFDKREWSELRKDMPLTLNEGELEQLRGLNEPVSMDEVIQVYLPVSRLLNLYVEATQGLYQATSEFLGNRDGGKTPFIIGMAGSVAVGKSTFARILRVLLSRWPGHPKVDLVPTDGFLRPNAELEAKGLMEKKGFPVSFNRKKLLCFLSDIKAGKRNVAAPVYSHVEYDVLPNREIIIDRPDILIVEGLNVLRPNKLPKHGSAVPYVSDFFDFSIFIDADERTIRTWYIERFLKLRRTAFRDPASYFHKYSPLSDEETEAVADSIWNRINLVNLRKNILPTRKRADLILRKGADHRIESVSLRKL